MSSSETRAITEELEWTTQALLSEAEHPWRTERHCPKVRIEEMFLDIVDTVSIKMSKDGGVIERPKIDGCILIVPNLSGIPVCRLLLRQSLAYTRGQAGGAYGPGHQKNASLIEFTDACRDNFDLIQFAPFVYRNANQIVRTYKKKHPSDWIVVNDNGNEKDLEQKQEIITSSKRKNSKSRDLEKELQHYIFFIPPVLEKQLPRSKANKSDFEIKAMQAGTAIKSMFGKKRSLSLPFLRDATAIEKIENRSDRGSSAGTAAAAAAAPAAAAVLDETDSEEKVGMAAESATEVYFEDSPFRIKDKKKGEKYALFRYRLKDSFYGQVRCFDMAPILCMYTVSPVVEARANDPNRTTIQKVKFELSIVNNIEHYHLNRVISKHLDHLKLTMNIFGKYDRTRIVEEKRSGMGANFNVGARIMSTLSTLSTLSPLSASCASSVISNVSASHGRCKMNDETGVLVWKIGDKQIDENDPLSLSLKFDMSFDLTGIESKDDWMDLIENTNDEMTSHISMEFTVPYVAISGWEMKACNCNIPNATREFKPWARYMTKYIYNIL